MSSEAFSEEQKQYLQGFIAGSALRLGQQATFAATLGVAPVRKPSEDMPAGQRQEIGRELVRDISAPDVPRIIESLLRAYLSARSGDEFFADFVKRHSTEQLRALLEQPVEV